MPKKTKIFNLTALTTLMVFTLAGCSKVQPSSESTNQNTSFNGDDYDLKDVVFESKTISYDGQPHTIFATNIPDGVIVTYTNNTGTDVGQYNAIAHFTSNDGRIIYKDKYATLSITDDGKNSTLDFSKLSMNDIHANYDGSKHTARLTDASLIPDGFVAQYSNNEKINAGKYVARCNIVNKKTNAVHYSIFSNIIIDKAQYDMSGVSFPSQTFPYIQGRTYTLEIQGELPKGVTVAYENNTARTAGSITTAVANFYSSDSNYEDPKPMTATLTVSTDQTCIITVNYFINNSLIQNATISKRYGEYLTDEDIIKRVGYTYTSNRDLSSGILINTQSMSIDIRYTASEYECSFVVDHGSKDTIKYNINSNETLGDPIMDNGYQFTGWYEDSGRTIPISSLQGRSGNIVVYAGVSEVTNTNTFVLKNSTYKWDSTEKTIDTIGGLPTNRTVSYIYEKIGTNGQSTILDEGTYPSEVGTYKVTGNFHNVDTTTGIVDNSISYSQTAYLFIEKNELDTSSITFNGGSFNADENKYPEVSGVKDYITYRYNNLEGVVNFKVKITYSYYDSKYNKLDSKPTLIGNYISVAHFEITDLDNVDASDRIEKIPDISTNFSIEKRTYNVDNIIFASAEYKSTASAPASGYWTLLATSGVKQENGKYYTNDGYLEITYSNNTIKYGDVGTLQAGMFFSWSSKATAEIKNMYNLPAPKYATLSVVSEDTCSVVFQTEDGTHLSQSEVTVGSAVAVPNVPQSALDKLNLDENEEYYWDADTGNQLTSVSHITRDTTFTLRKRNRINKIIITGYYDKNSETVTNLESTFTSTYKKGDTLSLKDLLISFSTGYELKSFQVALLSSSTDDYYSKADFKKEITVDDTLYTTSIYNLFYTIFNKTRRESIIIKVNSVPKTINVTYDLNGAENSTAIENQINSDTKYTIQTYGQKYVLPTIAPSKDGQRFIGWQLNSAYISSSVYCNLLVNEGTIPVIKAIFEDITNFSVSFVTNNGDGASIRDIISDQVIPFPESNPTKYGYSFVGWKLNAAKFDADGNTLKDGEYVLIQKNTIFNLDFVKTYFGSDDLHSIVLEAVWETIDITIRMYSYEYDESGSLKIFREVKSKFNENLLNYLPTDNKGQILYPENVGSNFISWTYNGRNILVDTKITTYIEENGVYYINITPTYDSQTFTIVYDLNYPSASSSIQQIKGSDTYQLASSPKRTGYKFAYWYLDGDLDEDGNPIDFYTNHYLVDDGKFIYKKNIILKAYWTIKTYQVSFVNRENNQNWTDSVYYPYGTILSVGHGWIDDDSLYNILMFTRADELYYTDSSSKVLAESAPLLFDSDTETTYTIYILKTEKTFLVTYTIDSTSQPLYQRVKANSAFNLLSAPVRPGMEFKAWCYYSGDALVEINGNTFTLLTSNDLVLYAKFTPLQYSIKYVLPATGTEIHEETIVTFGETFSLPNANEININGYNFLSWRDANGNSVDSDTLLKTPPSNTTSITLYAVLEAAQFTITYDPNNGSDTPHVDYARYNSSYNLYADPVREGYSFTGWAFYDADTNVLIQGETSTLLKQGTFAYAGNIRAKATWIGITYDVNFFFEGVKVIFDEANNPSMDQSLSKLYITKQVDLGSNIDMVYDEDDLFTYEYITIDGTNYKAYFDGTNYYINPVGLFYDSLDSWVESASNVAVKNEKNSKYLLTNTGGTEFSAKYVNKTQTFTFRFKYTNSVGITTNKVLVSTQYTFGDVITLPNYEPNDLYNFYGWIAEEDHVYDEKTDGPDSGYKYVEGAKIPYDVVFDRYAAKNNFIFNIIFDAKKAFYIIQLDGVKYLKVNPNEAISETDDIYTTGLTADDKALAMADDVIGRINKGESVVLPNIAKNENNNYYKTITVNNIKFHPCDRTIYKIGSEYLMDGSVYNIGMTGSQDNPNILQAYSCYVAGEYRQDGNFDTFTDFMILKDRDSSGKSFVNGNGTELTGLNEVAFCGFVDRTGAQKLQVKTPETNGHGDFYIPPFYFDGTRVKKVSMIASGAMDDGAFTNISFDKKTNIHLSDSIQTIASNTFTNVTIEDLDNAITSKSVYTVDEYNAGNVFGKVIYEGTLASLRKDVTIYDTNLSSSNAPNPVWCYDSVNGRYEKDINYSVITWWNLHKDDLSEFTDADKVGKVQDTKMYIADNSSITLNYFYGTKEEYLDYCNTNYGGNLNRNDKNNRFVAVFNSKGNDAKNYYPEIIYVGDNNGDSSLTGLLSLYQSESLLESNKILGRRVTYFDDDKNDFNYLYLADAEYACANYSNLVRLNGETFSEVQITTEAINIVSNYSSIGEQTVYYPISLQEFINSSAHTDNVLDKVVYVKYNLNGKDVPFRVYDKTVTDANFDETFVNKLYNQNENEFIYFFYGGNTIDNIHLTYFGSANDILLDEDKIYIASDQHNFKLPTISIFGDQRKTTELFYGTYLEYVKNRTDASLTKDQIYDGKTILTILNDSKSSLIQAFFGDANQFYTNRTNNSISPSSDTVYRAVLSQNNEKEVYIYNGDINEMVKNNYGLYANKYCYVIPIVQNDRVSFYDLLFVGTANNFIESTYDSNNKDVYLNANNNNLVYTYASNRNNTNLFPVYTSKYDSIDQNILTIINKFTENGLMYFYLEEKVASPTSSLHNTLLPYFYDTFENAYKLSSLDSLNRYSAIRNTTCGFISNLDGYSILNTAENYYNSFLNDTSNYNKVASYLRINTLSSSNVSNFQLNTYIDREGNTYNGNGTFLSVFYLSTYDKFLGERSSEKNGFAKVFTSANDRTPIDVYILTTNASLDNIYQQALSELNRTFAFNNITYNYYNNNLDQKIILYYTYSITHNPTTDADEKTNPTSSSFFNGTASQYLSSNYVTDASFNKGSSVIKLKDNLALFFDDVTKITSSNVSNYLYNNQIYALLNNDATTTKNNYKLVNYFTGTSEDYRSKYTEYDNSDGSKHAIETGLFDNSNNYIFVGGGTYTTKLLLLNTSSTIDNDILSKSNLNKDADVIFSDRTITNKTTITLNADGTGTPITETEEKDTTETKVFVLYLGTTSEFNTNKNITQLSNYNTSTYGEFVFTLDNSTYQSSRSLVANFYQNYDDLIKNNRLFKETKVESSTSGGQSKTTTTELDKRISINSHFVFSDLLSKGFAKNIGKFNADGDLIGVEDNYFAFYPFYSSNSDTSELLFVKIINTSTNVTSKVGDAYAITVDTLNEGTTTNNMFKLSYTGTFYTNDDNAITNAREITGIFKNYSYSNPANINEQLVVGSDQYHQQLDFTTVSYTMIELAHSNYNTATTDTNSDTVYFVAKTLTDLEANDYYKKLSIYSTPIDDNGTTIDRWNGINLDAGETGEKYKVYVIDNTDGNEKYIRAYTN